MTQLRKPARRKALLLVFALLGVTAMAAEAATVPLPKPRPIPRSQQTPLPSKPAARQPTAAPVAAPAAPVAPRRSRPAAAPLASSATSSTPQADIQTLEQVIEQVRARRPDAATSAAATLTDPLARKLAEWIILRSDNNGATTERYRAFIASNPSWPSIGFLRRRAEATLWDDRRDNATVLALFASEPPLSAKGKFVLARAELARGDRAAAQRLVRDAWRSDDFAASVESAALDEFGALLTASDHKARVDFFLYKEETESAQRVARHLGGAATAITRARIAVINKAGNAKALLDAVPEDARQDAGYIFSRAQWLRRHEKPGEAAQLLQHAPRDPARLINLDEWWIERRVLSRELLDAGQPQAAYGVARDATPPTRGIYKTEHEFTAGWIALRFLNDPATAARHFARVGADTENPTAKARGGYWQGRAAEALGHTQEAQTAYRAAAAHSTSYYGQLARARLGLTQLALRGAHAPAAGTERLEVVRAIDLLYALEEKDIAVPMLAELGERGDNPDAIAALAEIAGRNGDARGQLLIGKAALNAGLPFDHYAYPVIGIPAYQTIGPAVEKSIVYAIARQESAFNPTVVSSAKAMGLMQVTAGAGRQVAKKFGVGFDAKRLLSDPAYNVAFGAAELAELIENYRGSYILTFAAYNAGRGRIRQWLEKYGDPRAPGADVVDWVERIPFSETRNYVQRILENLQVYRARFGGGSALMIEADLRRGRAAE